MTFFQSLILAFVQGVTEFLPISSSGHLNLLQHFFGFTPSLSFDVFLNTASLLTVLVYFRSQIKYFFTHLPYIIIGSIPAALVGILFKDQVETVFSNIHLLPYFFLLTSLYLLSTKFIKSKESVINYQKALIIGIFQAIAILPAVSRSGSTIFAGLLVGLGSLEAFNFSFALFAPASFGALLLSIKHFNDPNIISYPSLIAFMVTFIIGLVALKILKKSLTNHHFWRYGLYTLILSLLLFTIL